MKKVNLKKTIFLFTVLTVAAILLFSVGCKKEMPYNAKLYDSCGKWMSEEFLKENRVAGYYKNENYVEGVDSPDDDYIYDKDSPSSRTFIITKQQEFDKIFTKYDAYVDLEKQTVILYIFSDDSPRNYYLIELKLENESLTVHYILEKLEILDSVMLYQRCFMLVLDKQDIKNVVFIEQR